MNYKQPTENEKYQIDAMNQAGHSQKETAEFLARSASTISQALRLNRSLRGYRPCLPVADRPVVICTRTYEWHPGPAASAMGAMIFVASSRIALLVMNGR